MSLVRYLSGLLMIVRKSIAAHKLSSSITIASSALASGLVMAVFVISHQCREGFANVGGYDAVVGGRGSKLQLVLNSVFHLEASPGNVGWDVFKALKENPSVELAIPYVLGDNYRDHRVIGTTSEIFTEWMPSPGKKLEFEQGGRPFDDLRREAVIGSLTARNTGLRVGSRFNPSHGLKGGFEHDSEYVVVGVLEPTSSPNDRVIWIPLEGAYRMEGHFLRGAGEKYVPQPRTEIPEEHREVSAVMLVLEGGQAGFALDEKINKQGQVATFAWPIATIVADFFNKMAWGILVLEYLGYLVMVIAAGSILASLYNTMNERRREFAILRALGARRGTVFGVIVLESTTLAALGALVGFLVYAVILFSAARFVREKVGVTLDVSAYHHVLGLAPPAMILLGALSGILPALRAYRTEVSDTLSHN